MRDGAGAVRGSGAIVAESSIDGPFFDIKDNVCRCGLRIRRPIRRNVQKVNMETSAAGIAANAQINGPALACPWAIPQQQDVRFLGWIIKQNRHIPHRPSIVEFSYYCTFILFSISGHKSRAPKRNFIAAPLPGEYPEPLLCPNAMNGELRKSQNKQKVAGP
jgi:hypothetical protein